MSHTPPQPHALSRGTTNLNPPEPVRVGIYTRWPSPEDNILQSYVESRPGWHTVMRCSDHASGRTLNRPGLQRALNAARAGLLDVLLVDNVHSLSRRVRHLHFLLGKLDAYGVAFHSAIDQSLDTSTPEGRFQVQMLGSFAQFEEEGVLEDRRAARASSTGLSDGCPLAMTWVARSMADRLATAPLLTSEPLDEIPLLTPNHEGLS
ncbi:recombinase family protein [Saccharomonospora viridis]|jgi:hypothetical protein|uniref:recombinase family protein n=1 Tax=Saccharomonospora viridis TaxID=1852 RepID=UPI0024091D0C|nr:recombinase family protein [Saccharomonospora viridis]